MVYKRFTVRLALRLILVGAAMTVFLWLLTQAGYRAVLLVSGAILASLIVELWRFINRTNREVARFLDAARYADFSQRFSLDDIGSGFGELGETFTDILERLRRERSLQATDVRQLKAMIEHIPIPLLTLHHDDSISLENNASRRLFGIAQVTRLSDLRQFGSSFRDAVAESIPGRRELVVFTVEGVEYRLTLATTEIIVAGNADRLISLQDIQSELDETQAEAWQDLVRVLTHEIMNSITPITSLAKTAADVVDDAIAKKPDDEDLADDLQDLRKALTTVARRSDSLVQFVDSYRQLTRLAPPEKKRIDITDLFDEVIRLSQAEWPDATFTLTQEVMPTSLDVYADRDLLEPVLLNLVRNALQATSGQQDATVQLIGRLNRRGNIVLEVSDNGPGVPGEILRKIFVPFFTTKEGGSGVGLALARQVMVAQGGFIRVGNREQGGAVFSLTF